MEMRRGVLRNFDAGTYRAAVEMAGSLSTYLTSVPVARNVAAADMVNGRNVALLLFDPSNPDDMVVAAVWT